MATTIDIRNAPRLSAEWWLGRLAHRLAGRQSRMQLMDDYYEGKHRATWKVRDVLAAFGFKDKLFVNYCAVVVDSLNERLGINGFRFGKDDAATEAAWELWQSSGLDAGFKRGMRSGLVKGEFSVLVWPGDEGETRITIEDGQQMIVAVDPANPRKRRAALKLWKDDDAGRTYATVYLAEGIFKFQTAEDSLALPAVTGTMPANMNSGGGAGTPMSVLQLDDRSWERRIVTDAAGNEEPWPVPNPFAVVPVIPIPTKPDTAGVGTSEITDVVPIQDAINANVANVMLAGLYGAFRQKWAINVELEEDPATGKLKEPWDVAVDRLMTAPPPVNGEPPVQFGEFGQTELAGYISLHETFVQAVATTSRLPVHYLLGQSGSFPSGESLGAAERGLSEKARERAGDTVDPVEDAMRLAFRMEAAKAGVSNTQKVRLLKWAAMTDAEAIPRDPEARSESQHYDALTKLRGLEVPRRAVWAMIPATPQTILAWEAQLAAEKAEAKKEADAAPPVPPVPAPGTMPPAAGGPEGAPPLPAPPAG